MPVTNEIINLIEVPENEKETLKILNNNSRISLEELSKELGISKTAALY